MNTNLYFEAHFLFVIDSCRHYSHASAPLSYRSSPLQKRLHHIQEGEKGVLWCFLGTPSLRVNLSRSLLVRVALKEDRARALAEKLKCIAYSWLT